MIWVGDDWAEDRHDVELLGGDGRRLARARLPEGLQGNTRLHALIGNPPQVVGPSGPKVATLYRRYPTRADPITAAFEAEMSGYAEAARQAVADPDPWPGFCADPKVPTSEHLVVPGRLAIRAWSWPRAAVGRPPSGHGRHRPT